MTTSHMRVLFIAALSAALLSTPPTAAIAQRPQATAPPAFIGLWNNTTHRLTVSAVVIDSGAGFDIDPPQIIERGARGYWIVRPSYVHTRSEGYVTYSVENAYPAYAHVHWDARYTGPTNFDGQAGGLFTITRTLAHGYTAEFQFNCVSPHC
ncbi:hypothetical protein [Nocardia sp. NPDC051832]|uniref:hypothetical protein n=1 Tax=Nocardia sp. NPDC051832 TaxID=3155673 RepID=UPI003417DB7F